MKISPKKKADFFPIKRPDFLSANASLFFQMDVSQRDEGSCGEKKKSTNINVLEEEEIMEIIAICMM